MSRIESVIKYLYLRYSGLPGGRIIVFDSEFFYIVLNFNLSRMDNCPDNNIPAGRELLLDLIRLASDYYYSMTVDKDGYPHHEWDTGSFEKISGYSAAELENMGGFAALIHPQDLGAAQERINELLKGNPVTSILRIICRDGSVKYIEDRGMAEKDPETGNVIRLYGVAREITPEVSKMEKMTSLSDDYKFIAELNDEFNHCSDLPSLGKRLSDNLCNRFGFDGSTLYLVNQDGTKLVAQNMALQGGAVKMIEKIIHRKLPLVEIDINNSYYYRDCLFGNKPLLFTSREDIKKIASEFASSPVLRKAVSPIMEFLNIRSVLMIPLWANNAPVGLIDLSCSGTVDLNLIKRIESFSGFLASSFSKRISEILLAEKEEHYRLMLENAGAGIGYYDTGGTLLMINSLGAAHLATTPDQLTGKNILKLFPGKEGRLYLSRIKQAIMAGGYLEFEDRVALPDGDKWFLSSYNRITSRSGDVTGIQIISTEITATKLAELALLDSEKRYRNLYDLAPYGILTCDINGIITSVNNYFVKISGYNRDQLVGLHFSDTPVLQEKKKSFYKKVFLDVIKSRSVNNIQFEWIHASGGKRVAEASVKIIRTHPDRLEVLAMISDITKRTESEIQLKKREDELRIVNSTLSAAQKMAKVGYWRYNVETTIPEWSEQMFHLFGLSPKDPVPGFADHKRMIHPDDWELFDNAVSMCVEKGRRYNIVIRIIHPDGKYHYIHTQGFPAMQKNGKIVELFGTSQDVTEIKEAERELLNSYNQIKILSKHIETVRESERKNIARELHDDLGQTLTALKMDLGWIEGRIPDTLMELKIKSRSAIDLVQNGIRNVQRMSSELRPSMLDNLGLIPAIEWYMAEFEDRSGIRTYFNFPKKDANFPDNVAIALYRVVQEALTNIYRHSGASIARVNMSRGEAMAFSLEISDNGSGIPKEKISAHDSFGLMGMMERIRFINGSFEIKSRKGKGTSIIITFPIKV